MKTIAINLLILVLLSVYVGPVSAHDEVDRTELNEQLKQLGLRYQRAGLTIDFDKQLELAKKLESSLEQIDEPRPLPLFDIQLDIVDLEKMTSFDESQLNLAKEYVEFSKNGLLETRRKKYEFAIDNFQRALEISDLIYGNRSFRSLKSKVKLAKLFSLTKNTQAGLPHAIEVARVLQNDRNESQLYLQACCLEVNLYLVDEEVEKAIDRGLQIVSLLEESGRQKTTDYYEVLGAVAFNLNQQERYKEAISYAQKVMHTEMNLSNIKTKAYYLRLLHEYTKAKVALGDYDKLPDVYDELLKISNEIPGIPLTQHVSYVEEYVPVLRKLGRNQEAEEMEQQIKQILSGSVPAVQGDLTQAELMEKYKLLSSMHDQSDFVGPPQKQLETANELHAILEQIDDPKPMSLFDLNLQIEDYQKMLAVYEAIRKRYQQDPESISSNSDYEMIKKIISDLHNAKEMIERENYDSAIRSYQSGLKSIEQLLGESSYRSLKLKNKIARACFHGKKIQEGLTYVTEVKQALEKRERESDIYLNALMAEINLLGINGEADKVIELSTKCESILEERNQQNTTQYLFIQSIFAYQLNEQEKHAEALKHARKSLEVDVTIGKLEAEYYILVMGDYIQANTALKDNESFPEAFDEILKKTLAIPDLQTQKKVKFLEEYIPYLRKLDLNDEAKEMEQKIKHLRFDLPLQKSRFTD